MSGLCDGIKRYEPTKKASPELRQYMRDRLFNPGPLTDEELVDFAAYLEKQGVAVHWVRLDGFSSDRDLCPYSWAWREARGEIKERLPAPAEAG
ncbi:hypothetical protein [Deinococcus sp. QL22]|uniref:hypothetical protein n=1 Tax=Deinococcus sp. QL22 TaxID=2939437 RepID=UPI002016B22A|nr:hypothetical protein [Deinococcus sp. QL22]UQN10314.1 hypothetical protein M1R55_29625 [Deinococcus sp. QL22]UQN10448.1 hypothetical protein M1R55_28950 [Deinococcus sp. QL22]